MSLRRTLDAMGAMVERASSVPLSASCMVNRAELLALVERARAELPVELDEAAELLVAHQEVISRAESEAEEMLARAQEDAERMIMDSALVASSRARSEQILDAARAEAARLLRECDLYCDNRLASFEDDLDRALGQIRRGRDRLRERSDLDEMEPLPEELDPEGYDAQAEYEEAVQRQHERAAEAAWAAGDEAYDHQADTEDAYDQERTAKTEDGENVDRPLSPSIIENPATGEPQPERVPAGVGASGPEHRVLDLTAVERAAEHSGLG